MESSDEELRVRKTARLMVVMMSLIVAIFVLGVAFTNPQFLAIALVAGLILVFLPALTYLYIKRGFHFLGDLLDR